jgi:protease-4
MQNSGIKPYPAFSTQVLRIHEAKGKHMKKLHLAFMATLIAILCFGCTGPRITLFPSASDPLREMILEGEADDKIQMIPVTGFISDKPKGRVMGTSPSVVQEVVSHLRLAEKDAKIKAVLLKIDTPGGTTTASDILYHEIAAFKERTGKRVVVCMMNIATSGGYYISLPADRIIAHPTTITGSVGVILIRPNVTGLMEKIGVGVQVNKSGLNKDMGSPFRPITPEEENLLQDLADTLGKRFTDLVARHRRLNGEQLATVADARLLLADAALAAGLVDKIGYLADAIAEAKEIAGLDADARVVTFRRTEYPDDNLYNKFTSTPPLEPIPLVDMGPVADLLTLDAGFYYLWPQALGSH